MLRHGMMLLAACGAAALFDVNAGRAEEPTPAQHLLGKEPQTGTARACFVRTYGVDHLAVHPKQTVAAMLLLVRGEKDTEEKDVNYTFSLGVKFRSKSTHFVSAGDCSHADVAENDGAITLHCSVDCDGGGLTMALGKDDQSTLVSIDQISIWRAGGTSEPENRDSLDGGADDRSFRLDRVSLDQCVPIADDQRAERAEAAAPRVQ